MRPVAGEVVDHRQSLVQVSSGDSEAAICYYC